MDSPCDSSVQDFSAEHSMFSKVSFRSFVLAIGHFITVRVGNDDILS